MTPELKAKWIAALRSGDYRQGREQLQSGDKYCCLGVLCVVADIPITNNGVQADGNSYVPIDALVGNEDVAYVLWRMNDNYEKSFADIAEYIEGHL